MIIISRKGNPRCHMKSSTGHTCLPGFRTEGFRTEGVRTEGGGFPLPEILKIMS